MILEDARKKPRFVTLFPETENIHLIKDVGMIPYVMYKNFDYDASIVTYQNGTYPYLDNEVAGLKLEYLSRIHNDSSKDVIEYLKLNAKDIDIIHLFHWIPRTFDWINIYQELNPKGKVYLKLDATESILNMDIVGCAGTWLLNILKKCHVVSVETLDLCQCLNDNWPIKVEYIPNGFHEIHKNPVAYQEKENTILTVGRIGTYQKASEVLLEAFNQAHTHMKNWNLKLVGPITPGYQQVIDNYLNQNPALKDKILFTGAIADRAMLEHEYSKAKIFCLPSRFESFGIVLIEAAKSGCYLITSNVTSAKDLTDNGRYGSIFEIDNTNQLAEELIKASTNEEMLKTNCLAVQKFAQENFHWRGICQRLHENLSLPTPNQNSDIAQVRNLITNFRQNKPADELVADQFLIDRFEQYPVAFKMPFWKKHSEYLAVREYPELAGSLLDFGCGTGHMDILLAREGRNVCGIDVSPLGIAIANYFRSKENYEVQEQVSFMVSDVTSAQTNNIRFDCAWASQVIEYIQNTEQIFTGLRNWLKDGAYMLISVPLGYAWLDSRQVHHFANAEELEGFLNKYISVIQVNTDNKNNMLRALCKF